VIIVTIPIDGVVLDCGFLLNRWFGLEFLPCRPFASGFGQTENTSVPETTMLQWKKFGMSSFSCRNDLFA